MPAIDEGGEPPTSTPFAAPASAPPSTSSSVDPVAQPLRTSDITANEPIASRAGRFPIDRPLDAPTPRTLRGRTSGPTIARIPQEPRTGQPTTSTNRTHHHTRRDEPEPEQTVERHDITPKTRRTHTRRPTAILLLKNPEPASRRPPPTERTTTRDETRAQPPDTANTGHRTPDTGHRTPNATMPQKPSAQIPVDRRPPSHHKDPEPAGRRDGPALRAGHGTNPMTRSFHLPRRPRVTGYDPSSTVHP